MTEKVELLNYDKSNWPSGEWNNEPDRVDFIHAGFSCLILRNPSGALCGYVGVPNTHSCYEKDYDEVEVEVHGGLTYADKCRDVICHIPEQGMPEDVWWLGFDCAHAGDYVPGLTNYLRHLNYSHGTYYKNIEYVTNEVKQLAEQLSKM